MAEEVVVVFCISVNGIQVFYDVVGFVIRIGMLNDRRFVGLFVSNRRKGVVRVVLIKGVGDGVTSAPILANFPNPPSFVRKTRDVVSPSPPRGEE